MIGAGFEQALADAAAGDQRCFELLWRDLNPSLERYLRALVGAAAAEDVAAETWISVLTRLADFRGGEQAWRAFVFTVARRRAVDEHRMRARRPVPAGAALDLPHDPRAVAGDCADAAAANLDRQHLLASLARLPRQQAAPVALRLLGGLDTRRIAALLDRSPGAVRVAVHRGLHALAAELHPGVRSEVPVAPG